MHRKLFLLIVVFLLILFSPSCVTKKKYLAMESARQSADAKVIELNTVVDGKNLRIEKMISEFEQMKNGLMESNAIKDQHIDSLMGELNSLAKVVSVKESTIGDKVNSFEFEKRRLTEDLAEQKQLVSNKQSENNQLSANIKSLNDELSQLAFDLNREKDEKKILQGNINSRDSNIAELTSTTDKLKSEIQSLKKQISDNNETINRLENNVKLLKQQLK